jgi:hypothetical protein
MSARRLVLSLLATTLGVLAFAAAPALAALETPEVSSVTAVTATTAHVAGVLNPKASGKVEGGYWGFQFGVSAPGVCGAERLLPEPFPRIGAPVGEPGVAAGLPKEVVQETLTGLQPHAEYTVCLLEFTEVGPEQLESVSVPFETEPAVPAVESDFLMFVSDSGAKPAEAQVGALVNANNEQITGCEFEYGTEPLLKAGVTKVPCEQAPSSFPAVYGGQLASASVSGLVGKTKYYYRLVARNATGASTGTAIESFTPPLKPEAPERKPASPVGATTATLHGVLNPKAEGEAGTYEFLYKQSASASECEGGEVSGGVALGGEAEAVKAEVSGLEPSARYTFCLLARNEAGETTLGAPETLTTAGVAPGVEGETATSVKASEATLGAQVNPNNQPTTYTFEYATSEAAIGTAAATKLTGGPLTGFGNQTASVPTGGVLAPGTVYYYRASAENKAHEKTTDATIEHFKTAIPVEEPETEPANPVGFSSARLHGVLNPTGEREAEPGTYEFLYKQSTSECEITPAERSQNIAQKHVTGATPAIGKEKEEVFAEAPGLTPGTAYTFCLLAANGSEAGEMARGPPQMFTTEAVAPAVTSEYVTKVQFTTATLNAQIDPGGAATTYHFEYINQAGYEAALAESAPNPYVKGQSTPESEPVAADNTDHAALASLTGLTPGTTYHYRAVAINAQSPGGTPGSDKTFTTPAEPGAAAETCPNAQARTEQPYGQALPDCRAYELVSPLEKNDRSVEAIDSRASTSDEPSGPEASAIAYLATGSFSEPKGANKVNRYVSRRNATGWSTESITPLSVAFTSGGNGTGAFGELFFTPTLSQGVLQSEYVPLVDDGEPAGYFNLYVADLATSPVSYQTVTNAPTADLGRTPYTENGYEQSTAGASTDLSHVVFQQRANLTPSAEGREEHVYEWTAGKLNLVDVPPAGVTFGGEDTVGAPGLDVHFGDQWHAVSASGLRVFFTAGENETHYNTLGQLYVRENPAQEQSPEPGGKCTVSSDACTIDVSKSEKTNGTGPEGTDQNSYGRFAESSDGEWIVEPGGRPMPAYYRDANAEGTRVFFTSRAELTNDANTGEKDSAANLYEYDFEKPEGERLADLTVNAEHDGADVLGLVTAGENVGENNSYVYFVANGVLASNENAGKETAHHGNCKQDEQEPLTGEHTCSLYVVHYNGGAWEPKFIATLAGGNITGSTVDGDEADWIGFEGANAALTTDVGPGAHTVRVTPDGTTLAFESERSLTGYDNEPVEPGAGAPGDQCTEVGGSLQASDQAVPCREVYLYDAVTGRLVCASCDPSGARPVGPVELQDKTEEGNVDAAPSRFYLSRNLSEDGKRLFFQSQDPLVPHDSNSQLDVYEWEQLASPAEAAKGESSCMSSSSTFSSSDGGCVFPISDVAGDFDSRFMDASASGNDVFIATKDQLVPAADADSRANVYDVRVGGGFPVSVVPAPCDNGDSCKPPVSAQPSIFAPSGSATFSGLGNPAPPPPPAVVKPKPTQKTVKCKRGFTKKKNKCVRHKSKKRKAKKSVNTNRRAK